VLHPLPADAIRGFVRELKAVIVPEVNYNGQFARHLRAQMGLEVLSFTKYGGLPFAPAEIAARVMEVMQELGVEPAAVSAEEVEV